MADVMLLLSLWAHVWRPDLLTLHNLSPTSMRAGRQATAFRPHVRAFSSASRHSEASRDTLSFTLPDGRTLGYAEYGVDSGTPLMFLHGYPGSRLEVAGIATVADKHNLRLISPDRPGFGISTPQPGRRILDWPADTAALMDHLGLDRTAILGGSGGGPYALACALAMPERLSAVGVLAGAPPWTAGIHDMPVVSRVGSFMAINTPLLARATTATMVGLGRWIANSGPVAKRIDAWLAQQSPEAAADPEAARERLLRITLEGFAQGSQATVDEARLLTTDWGFRFEDIMYDTVKIWHGTQDARSPIRMIRHMAERMPHSTLYEYDELDHFDIHKQLDEVVTELMRQ